MDSILTSVKKMIGIPNSYTHFDDDIIMHINSVFMILNQLGVGPDKGFAIQDDKSVWTDFIPDENKLQAVKSYMALKVRLLFDPPTSNSVMECMNRMISELEYRLNTEAEIADGGD